MRHVFVYVYFAINSVLACLGLYYLWQAEPHPINADMRRVPVGLCIFFVCLGALGIAATAPSIFFNDPYWLVDKIFAAISKLICLFLAAAGAALQGYHIANASLSLLFVAFFFPFLIATLNADHAIWRKSPFLKSIS